MFSRLLPFALPVSLIIAVDLFLAANVEPFPSRESPFAVGWLAGQFGWLAGWFALARCGHATRGVIVCAAGAMLGWMLARFTDPTWAEWGGVLALYGLLVFTTLIALRWSVPRLLEATGEHLGGRRFTISMLFSWTTLAAVFLGTWRWLHFPLDFLFSAGIDCLCWSALTIGAFSAAGSQHGRIAKFVGLCALVPVTAMLSEFSSEITLPQGLAIGGSLAAIVYASAMLQAEKQPAADSVVETLEPQEFAAK